LYLWSLLLNRGERRGGEGERKRRGGEGVRPLLQEEKRKVGAYGTELKL